MKSFVSDLVKYRLDKAREKLKSAEVQLDRAKDFVNEIKNILGNHVNQVNKQEGGKIV